MTETAMDSLWGRFADANKRFCKRHLQPRLYPVSHMTALDHWFRRRTAGIPEGSTLLEFGSGRTFRLTRLLGDRFATKCATDLDQPRLDEIPDDVVFKPCTVDKIPFCDSQFDVVVIRSVMEHVDDPDATFRELARVIRPGGCMLMNLPNKWDYVSVAARLAGRFKSSILKGVVRTKWADFPVKYLCNTRRSLTAVSTRAGFTVEEFLPLPSQPSYLSFFVPLYVVGAVYQFLVSLCILDVLQPSFVVLLRKTDSAEAPALGAGQS